ncbi:MULTISPECIES: efflux RND transporter periplasmic adaptor subunit [unclassified Moraxella]|uniref:efflux RND transporter periplasmic adaptor subunit n=1 Tax=unclassified Moraxella TaxID=2685852 RepID=UPI003AF5C07A
MKYPVLLLASLVSTSLLVACNKSDPAAEQAAAMQNMPPPTVNVLPVQFQAVPLTKQLSGKIVAYQEAVVTPQVSGIIEKQLFREGSFVKQGQPLFQINADNYTTGLAGSQAQLEQSLASVNTAKANYNNAVASLESRQAELALAQANLNRLQTLKGTNAISAQEYDAGVTQVRTAQAAVKNAQAQIGVAQANINAAEATSRGAKQTVNNNQINVNRTIVRAPISGVTGRSAVNIGALANAGQTTLLTISQMNPVYIDMSQSSAEMLALRQQLGNGSMQSPDKVQVQLKLPDGSIYPQIGQLSFRESRVDSATGTVNLRAIVGNDAGLLLPGMMVTSEIIQSVINNAVLLPSTAVTQTPKGDATVNLVDANSKIQVRPIKTNGTFRGQWIVTEGLQQGEKVVITGGAKVKPDQQVVAKPYTPESNGALSAQPPAQAQTQVQNQPTVKSNASASTAVTANPTASSPAKP